MFQICCLILAQYSPAKGLSCLHNNYLSLDKLHHGYNVYINPADLLVVVEALVPQGQQPGGPLQRVGAARLEVEGAKAPVLQLTHEVLPRGSMTFAHQLF